jgi:gliding-associated putative ABC transporter substrate-binding component GldG
MAKEFKAPVRIDLELLRETGDYFKTNNKPNQVMGILLEGTFSSAFNDYLPDSVRKSPEISYRSSSEPTRMIVISDADIAYNEVQVENGKEYPLPLGYSKQFKRVVYDNKDLLLNCVNYLLDDASLIDVRSRNIQVRKLDKDKISNEKNYWKSLNTASPLFVLAIFGTTVIYSRKKRWTKQN